MNHLLTIAAQFNNQTINLSTGRHLIGSNSFCQIRTSEKRPGVHGKLLIQNNKILVTRISDSSDFRLDGQVLNVGETVQIIQNSDLYVGGTQIKIHLIWSRNSKEPKESKDRETTTKLIAEIEKQFGKNFKPSEAQLQTYAALSLDKILNESDNNQLIRKRILNEVTGLGPLEEFLENPLITEIMVNGSSEIFVEMEGKLSKTNSSFSSDQALMNTIERIVARVGRRIDTSSPIVDARLRDGSRVNAIIPPLALRGPTLTIRKFPNATMSLTELVEQGSISKEVSDFLHQVVEKRVNLIVCGGTGSGKTTLLNALSESIPSGERIITIEDAAELRLKREHQVNLEARPPNIENKGAVSIRDLLKNSLRMRPDRIIVGECRGSEALDMLQAMNTGHEGSMTTAHANTCEDLLARIETMVLMAGMELPLAAIREQIAAGLELVISIVRNREGRRHLSKIIWLAGFERSRLAYQTKTLFHFSPSLRKFQPNRDNLENFIRAKLC